MLHLETLHQCTQMLRLGAQAVGSRGAFFDQGGVLLCHLVE